MEDQGPKRLPLAAAIENRSESVEKDSRLLNGFIEQTQEKELWVYKRPGMVQYSGVTAGTGRGLYNWSGNVYSIVGGTVYKDGVAVSGSVDTTNGTYTFSACLGATPKLFMQNGVKAYTYDSSGGLVNVSDVDYPTTTCKGSGYLDGTTYVMTSTANVYGSGINDPTSWTASNMLVAQIEPDGGVALSKQLVYIIALKQWSTEVFYDAGNASGSPLAQVQGAKANFGCRHQDTVREIDGSLYWVSQTRSGSVSVVVMDGLKITAVSTPPIDRLLQQSAFSTVYSWTTKIAGHKFYVLTLVDLNLTLVFDITSKRWYQWTDANGNYLPIVAATFSPAQQPLVQHASNGKVYTLSMGTYLDDGGDIVWDLYTPNFDGGVKLRKILFGMDFVADQTPGSVLQVRCSDDDYTTWSNFRKVDLGQKYPRLTNCGTFRRRAYHFRHVCNTALRIKAVDLHLDIGTL